jgi:phage tail sheath protein FI
MPTVFPNVPGVKIQEVRLEAPPIQGVGTSTAGFVGQAPTVGVALPDNQFPNVANRVTSADQFIAQYIGIDPATQQPIATRSTPLSRAVLGFFENGGIDCYVVNVPSGTPTNTVNGIRLLEVIDEIAILAAPGFTDVSVYNELEGQALRTGDRFAILDPPARVNNLNRLNTGGADRPPASDYAAFYYPRILVGARLQTDPAPNSATPDFVTPSGHIAGLYARVDGARGVHKAPANEVVLGALGVEHDLTDAQQNTLNGDGVNILRVFSGNTVLWGARTVSTNTDWRYINVRRLANYIEESLQDGLRFAVFEPNIPPLRQQITRSVRAFLNGVWRDGGLFGETADQAYYVRFPEAFNTDAERALGRLTIEIGLRVSYPAEFIIIRIGLLLQSPGA